MNRRRERATGIVAAFVVGLVTWQLWFPGQEFDAKLWQTDASGDSGVRQRMADRLLARHRLTGLTRGQVVAMLGEPPTDDFSDSDLVYLVGPERGFLSIDWERLVLQFGADGRVIQAKLVTD